jgi:hypothetical protein
MSRRRVGIRWLLASAALLVTAFVAFGLSSGTCTTPASGPPTCVASRSPSVAPATASTVACAAAAEPRQLLVTIPERHACQARAVSSGRTRRPGHATGRHRAGDPPVPGR